MNLQFFDTNSPFEESGFDWIEIDNTSQIIDAIIDTFAGGDDEHIASIFIDLDNRYFKMTEIGGPTTEGCFFYIEKI